ncbi:MAG TPA: DUF805 domain-containing protein [Devosia sp.]|nr:DUF805 domain-containing protein [Devosia sp.]
MNGFLQNYIGFDGRLNRQPFWISGIVLAIVGAIIQYIIMMLMGGASIIDVNAMMQSGRSTQEIVDMFSAVSTKSGWASLITLVILAYPVAAISIKRRHDRGSAGMEVWIYLALAAIIALIQALGLGMTTTQVGELTVPTPTLLFNIIALITGILGLYLLVVMGFLKGTAGPNAYGPDPLGG